MNGAYLTRYSGVGRPNLSDCAAIPIEQWVPNVVTADLRTNPTLCVVTAEGRYAYVQVQEVIVNVSGELSSVTYVFLTWKGPRD